MAWRCAYHSGTMVTISFTPNLSRHLDAPAAQIPGDTVGQVLDDYFRAHPRARGYVLDDQGAVRSHVVVFVNNEPIRDRAKLTDVVADGDTVFVFQALSGG